MDKVMLLCSGYSNSADRDIAILSVDRKGIFEKVCEYFQGDNPSFLYTEGEHFYTCSETEEYGAVTKYECKNNKINRLKTIKYSGQLVCHIQGWKQHLITCAYGSGTVSILDCNLTNETLISDTFNYTERKSHAHWSTISPDKKFLFAADLGRDCIWSWSLKNYRLNVKDVRCMKVKQGCGPRQILFDENKDVCYVIGELDNTVSVFEYQRNGKLLYKDSYRVSDAETPCYTGTAALDGNGRLFIANRGPDTISVFLIDGKTNLIKVDEFSCGGCWPRYITILKNERILLVGNQKSGELLSFDVSKEYTQMLDKISFPEISCMVPYEV